MKFGIELHTCTAGVMRRVLFATAADIVDTAIEAEHRCPSTPAETSTDR